jgi:cbb3-type cytochrome oxidase subunit 3
MLSTLASEFFAASPFLLLPVIALFLFLCAFTAVTWRALRKKPAELEPIARLPLADDLAETDRE